MTITDKQVSFARRAEQLECCTSCGRAFGGEHVCFYEGRQVCTDCHTHLVYDQPDNSPAAVVWAVGMAVCGILVLFAVGCLLGS